MGLVLAGLLVFGSLLGCVYLLDATGFLERGGAYTFIPALLMLFAISMVFRFFNARDSGADASKSADEHFRALERAGLIVEESFSATRAFSVAEFEDEGLHYFIELSDGRVLFLSGQYLYDSEPLAEGPEFNQSRRFPCSRFTLRRHRTEGYVADIICDGHVLEPEFEAPAFDSHHSDRDLVPSDGDILDTMTYDEIKSSRQNPPG